jgi:hypothetical protein
MIDTLLNLLFRCAHRHLTRPITPVSKAGVPHGETYVVCLDCAKQFAYDLKEMRIGKAIEHPHDACVLPSNMPTPGRTKVKYALGTAVQIAVLIASAIKAKQPNPEKKREKDTGPDSGQSNDAGSPDSHEQNVT